MIPARWLDGWRFAVLMFAAWLLAGVCGTVVSLVVCWLLFAA